MSADDSRRPSRRCRGRRLLTTCASLTAMLVIGLWARSHWYAEAWVPVYEPFASGLASASGGLYVLLGDGSEDVWTYERIPAEEAADNWPEPIWSFAGVGRYSHDACEMLRVPYPLLLAGPLLVFLWPVPRALRRAKGCCPGCGYDLRATPDRCPECGAVPTTTKTTVSS